MCEQSESGLICQLTEDNKKLSEELKFERKLNNILENIRNNSLILIQNCECIANQNTIKSIKQLNTIYTDLKTKQNISKLNEIQNEINIIPIPIQETPKNNDNFVNIPQINQNSGRVLRTAGIS